MKLTIEAICALLATVFTCGGILIYIGRQVAALNQMSEGLKMIFTKSDRHDADIARIDKELCEVKTRQEDCGKCP